MSPKGGTNRGRIFFSVADRKLYLRLIRENLDDAGIRVLAYCLMTNHVHFIVIPAREEERFGRRGRRSEGNLEVKLANWA